MKTGLPNSSTVGMGIPLLPYEFPAGLKPHKPLPDNPPIDEDFFAKAKRVNSPQPKQQITLRIDSETLDWFKKQGRGYQTMMNAVLRAYKDSRQDSSKTDRG